jgi:hypothetical protein
MGWNFYNASGELQINDGGVQATAASITNDLTVTSGNVVIATAGKGIDFSAQTATTSGTVDSGGEVLDHYEEGTFTATFEDGSHDVDGQTYSEQLGQYTRIGNKVWFNFRITLTSLGNLSGGASYIGGLPFAKVATSAANQGGHILYYYYMSWSTHGNPSLFVEGSNSFAELYGATATTNMAQIAITQYNDNSVLMGLGFYEVA